MADGAVSVPTRVFFGFVAGFFATLVFHQLMLALLYWAGVALFGPFPIAPTHHPFRVPVVISLAFRGGVWGILFGLERVFRTVAIDPILRRSNKRVPCLS